MAERDDGPDSADEELPERTGPPRTQLWLFAATLVSVFLAGAMQRGADPSLDDPIALVRALPTGWTFAVPLMAILLTHELGHYFAARWHRVPASLPYFLPLPYLSPFGTMGAVIAMRGRIRSKNALLDIGASGPIAGLVVALPVLCYGLATSEVTPLEGSYYMEGQSLFYIGLKYLVLGPIPAGHDVQLNPIAFAGWTGLFVTALNLLPVAQLDGGHIAYALFDEKQNRYASWLHLSLLAVFGYNVVRFMIPVVRDGAWDRTGQAVGNSMFWLVWFGLLWLIRRYAGRDHPPTEPGRLTPGRRAIAGGCLVLFVLLFMPTPWAAYG